MILPLGNSTWLRIAGATFLLGILWLYNPSPQSEYQLCGFHWLTGRPCPLCGLTHALCALAKGHWLQALHFNALSPVGFLMLFSLFSRTPLRARLWTVGVAVFACYGVLRVMAPAI